MSGVISLASINDNSLSYLHQNDIYLKFTSGNF